jgi:hypothetical protein
MGRPPLDSVGVPATTRAQREQVLARTLQVLPEQVYVHADVILHLARRPS